MKRIISLITVSVFSLVTFADVYAAGVPSDTLRILAIGNSFSEDAVEQYLFELFEEQGIPVIIGNMYIGGCCLERHVSNSINNTPDYAYRKISDGIKVETRGFTLERALADEQWDYVSFQQCSHMSGIYETWESGLPELYSFVRERVPEDVIFMIHQTWAYAADSNHGGFANYDRNQGKMYSAIMSAVKRASELTGISVVIPSGTAVQNARTSYLGDNLTRDGFHLGWKGGRYLASCTWFEIITGKNVMKSSYAPEGVSEIEAKTLRRSAHSAVKRPYKVTSQK